MADWTETVSRSHLRAQRELARKVNGMSVSVPIGDDDLSAPGYLLWDRTYSCVPDVQYPWDPDIIRAIRQLEPDFMPAVSRTVIRYSNYHDNGRLGDPIVLVRHVIARAILDPICSIHSYPIEMPSTPYPGLQIPGRPWRQCRPNYIELELYDRNVREYGYDLPGQFQPFSWPTYYQIADGWGRMKEAMAQTRREEKDGKVVAKGAANLTLSNERDAALRRSLTRESDAAYIQRDLDNFYSIEPSDLEWREANLGEPKRPAPPVSITVGASS